MALSRNSVTRLVRQSRGEAAVAVEGEGDSGLPFPVGNGEVFDPRSQQLKGQFVVDPGFVEALSDVFAGTDFLHHERKVAQLIRIRAEVVEHWSGMRDRFLAVGRALLELDSSMTKFEMERLRAGTSRLFPFSAAVASQLRQVARSVQSGKLTLETCPGSYSAAYQLVQLTDEEFQLARDEGLIRPDVSRSALIEFRRRLLKRETRDVEKPQDKRKSLVAKEASLRKELETVRAQIADLDRQIAIGRQSRSDAKTPDH